MINEKKKFYRGTKFSGVRVEKDFEVVDVEIELSKSEFILCIYNIENRRQRIEIRKKITNKKLEIQEIEVSWSGSSGATVDDLDKEFKLVGIARKIVEEIKDLIMENDYKNYVDKL